MLIRHSAIYIVAKIVPGALGLATTALLTRLLAPADYGVYGVALLVMTFGANIAFDWLGLAYLRVAQNHVTNHADRPRATSTFARIFAALVAATALLALAAAAFGLITPAKAGIVTAGLLMAWAYSWFELLSCFQIAQLDPATYLRMNLGRAALTLLGAGAAAWITRDPVSTAYGTAAAMILATILRGLPPVRAAFDPALARLAIRFGLPLAASLVLTSLVGTGTRAMVEWLGSIEALGLYTAALVLVQNTLGVVAAGIAAAGFSLAVRAVNSGDAAAARRQLDANATLLLAILAPAALGMALTAPGIAVTLVGTRFVATVAELTPWMAAGALFAGLRAHYLDHAFQLGRRPAGQVWVTAGNVVVTTALALLLIPGQGPLGAAIAVAVGAATACLHALWAGRAAYPLPLPLAAAAKIAAACAAMTTSVLLVPPFLPAQIAAGALAYAAAALAFDLLGLRTAILTRTLRPQTAAP